jgi:hypothetical protein
MPREKRITTIAFRNGDHCILGKGWAGDGREVRQKLADMQGDGEMWPDTIVVRLPRRFVTDFRGCVYPSKNVYLENLRDGPWCSGRVG